MLDERIQEPRRMASVFQREDVSSIRGIIHPQSTHLWNSR